MHPRWFWWAILVWVGTLAVVGAVLAGGRRQVYADGSPFGCLRFSGEGSVMLLDLRTGITHADPRPDAHAAPTRGDLSPDGRYRAHLVWNGRQDATNTLYLYPAGDPAGGSIKVQDDIQSPFHFHWSRNGERMAYVWSNQGNGYLTVANADGSNRRSTPLDGINVYETFLHGWSVDSRYLLLSVREGSNRRLELWTPETLTKRQLPLHEWISHEMWSPNARYLLYQFGTSSFPNDSWLNIVTLDTLDQQRFKLTAPLNGPRLSWSPDGQSVLAQYFAELPILQTDVFTVDGRAYQPLSQSHVPGDLIDGGMARWLPGDSTLLYLDQPQPLGAISLTQFSPKSGESRLLVSDVPHVFVPSRTNPAQLALVERVGENVQGMVLNVDTGDRHILFTTREDFGDPTWSDDGRYVAFTWSVGTGAGREVKLSWMRADGRDKQVVSGFADIKDLRWLPGDRAVFIGRHRDGFAYQVHWLNLHTATLIDSEERFTEVWRVTFDAQEGLYQVWGKRSNGALGLTTFATNGVLRQVFRFAEMPTGVYHDSVFIAPGGQVALAKTGQVALNERLQLLWADGSWSPYLVSDLRGLGNPLWSPDGKLFAFTQARNGWPKADSVTLEVYTAGGQHLRSMRGASDYYSLLTWTDCG